MDDKAPLNTASQGANARTNPQGPTPSPGFVLLWESDTRTVTYTKRTRTCVFALLYRAGKRTMKKNTI